MSWRAALTEPLPYSKPRRGELRTLKDAADYILKLPKDVQNHPQFRGATMALIEAAERRGSRTVATLKMKAALLVNGMIWMPPNGPRKR